MPSMSSRPSASRSRAPSAEATGSGAVDAGKAPYGCQTWRASAVRRSAASVGPAEHAGVVVISGVRGAPRAGPAGTDGDLRLLRGGLVGPLGPVGPLVLRPLQDLEPGVGDHLQILAARLALTGEVVTQEQRVGHVQRDALELAQVTLADGGQAHLGVRVDQEGHREDALAINGGVSIRVGEG